jgi:chaperonin GroES
MNPWEGMRPAFLRGPPVLQEEPPIMANIRPLQDRVIVKRVKEEEKTKGGIIIPDTAKEKPIEGEVIAVGNGKVQEDGKVRPLDVKVGDRVLFGKYSGTEVKLDGEEHLILREDDILGIIEKLTARRPEDEGFDPWQPKRSFTPRPHAT